MTDVTPPTEHEQPMTSKLLRGAIWIAIGALIAAALVCVVWVLIGDQDGIIGRAFMTILLLALFAGIAIAESHLAERRPDWLALASMITWIVALLVGAVKIWMPEPFASSGWMIARFFQLLLVIGIMQLALVHVRLFLTASRRYVTTFTRVIVMVTFAMLAGLVAMLVFFLTFPDLFEYRDLYWRIVIALAILVAVGTTLIPLLNALFAPRVRTSPPAQMATTFAPAQPAPQPVTAWPTYADGRTPLPVLADGSPDWNAYYTGYPSTDPYAAAPVFPVLDAPVADAPVAAPGSAPQQTTDTPNATPTPPAPPAPYGSAPAPAAPTAQPASAGAPAAPAVPPAPPAPPAPPVPPSAPGTTGPSGESQ